MQAKDARVGDTIRIEGVVVSNEHPLSAAIVVSIPGDKSVTVWNAAAATVELVKRAMPKFEPGGILRYCHDPVKFPNDHVDWIVLPNELAVELKYPRNIVSYTNDLNISGLSLSRRPNCWTYFPPATTNDNGTRLG